MDPREKFLNEAEKSCKRGTDLTVRILFSIYPKRLNRLKSSRLTDALSIIWTNKHDEGWFYPNYVFYAPNNILYEVTNNRKSLFVTYQMHRCVLHANTTRWVCLIIRKSRQRVFCTNYIFWVFCVKWTNASLRVICQHNAMGLSN